MERLRPPNSRTTVVVDPAAFGVADPSRDFIGKPRGLGRERLLHALPLDPGPACLRVATVVRDPGPARLADPDGALIGTPAVWVARLLVAVPGEDTRALGGGGAN